MDPKFGLPSPFYPLGSVWQSFSNGFSCPKSGPVLCKCEKQTGKLTHVPQTGSKKNDKHGRLASNRSNCKKRHKNAKEFKCDRCSYQTGRSALMRQHCESVHTGVKEFKCGESAITSRSRRAT